MAKGEVTIVTLSAKIGRSPPMHDVTRYLQFTRRWAKAKSLLVAFVCSILAACGNGGSGSNTQGPPPPPPPPVAPNPADPLSITVNNGDEVLRNGAEAVETLFGISVFAANHLVALANLGGNQVQASCDFGGDATAVNADQDASASLTAGDVVTVTLLGDCAAVPLGDRPARGSLDISLNAVTVGTNRDAQFAGTIALNNDFQIDTSGAGGEIVTVAMTGVVEFSIAITKSQFFGGHRLSLQDGSEIVLTVDVDSGNPATDRITAFDHYRQWFSETASNDNYRLNSDISIQSEVLGGSASCSTTAELRSNYRDSPTSGRFACAGSGNSAVAVLSDRASTIDPLVVEIDPDGDGTFEPLSSDIMAWLDLVSGVLYESEIDRLYPRDTTRTFGDLSVQSVPAAASDVVYNPVNGRLYVSNLTGIVEVDPADLTVTRSVSTSDEPTALAISDDGSTLWFGFSDIAEAGSLDLATFQPGNRISLGVSSRTSTERRVSDIVVVPGTTDDLVITMQSSEEIVAYDNGTELPNGFIRGPSKILFRSGNQVVGVDDTSSGFDVFDIDYVDQSGVTLVATFGELSPGFNTQLSLGSVDVWNSAGNSFNEADQARTGRVNGTLDGFGSFFANVVVSPADGLVYSVESRDFIVEVFDESTRTRIAAYRFDTNDVRINSVSGSLVTDNELIFFGDARIARIPKADLQPNLGFGDCASASVSNVLVDGAYEVFGCPVRDFVYGAGRQLIYAALPGAIGPHGNSIVAIDPDTLALQAAAALTAEPISIDMSDDGAVLTVALSGATQLAEIDLETFAVKRVTSLGFGRVFGTDYSDPLIASAARARPGFPDEVAVATYEREIYMYSSGVRLPMAPYLSEIYTRLFFDANDSSRLVAHARGEVTSLRLNGSGLDNLGTVENVLAGDVVVRQGNLVLSGYGDNLDIGTLFGIQSCDFSDGISVFAAVAFANSPDEAVYVDPSSDVFEVSRCDLSTGQVSGPVFVPQFLLFDAASEHRLAMLGSGDLMYLYRGTLLKLTPAD